MTVDHMLAVMPATELMRWMAYPKLRGPLGAQRGDLQAAVIAKTIADVNRQKRGRRFRLSDFLLKWGLTSRGDEEDESARDRDRGEWRSPRRSEH
jgi:hypothetical protein